MDKLEQYLDQVCRSNWRTAWQCGSTFARSCASICWMRSHSTWRRACRTRRRLKKALEEFGKPDEVRTELEATHGQRMAWMIDKAMQWKEKTMQAKWLWMTWAYLALVIVILALEVAFITFNGVFIIPKFQKLMYDGIIDPGIIEDSEVAWMVAFVGNVRTVGDYATWLLLVALVAVGLFEWRVQE